MHAKRQHKIDTHPKHLVDLHQSDPPKSVHWKAFDGLFISLLARAWSELMISGIWVACTIAISSLQIAWFST